jgi:hypothetical protein
MRRCITTLTGTVVLLALCAASATATGPTILFLPGETVPVTISGSSATAKGELQSAAGSLKGEGYTGSGTLETVTGAGHFSATLTHVKKGSELCETEGDAEGTVLFSEEEAQAVYTSLSPLTVGILALVKEITLNCGVIKIKKTGNILSSLGPINSETTSFSGGAECSATVGEPKLTKYWDSSGVERTALLLVNFGTGFKKACLTGSASATSTKMLEIMG